MENRTGALAAWIGWIAGIALWWWASGIVAAGAWWLLFWPVMVGVAVAYSTLKERREARGSPHSKSRHSTGYPREPRVSERHAVEVGHTHAGVDEGDRAGPDGMGTVPTPAVVLTSGPLPTQRGSGGETTS